MKKILAFAIFTLLTGFSSLWDCAEGANATCTASVPNINFGTYDTVDTISLSATDITVTCSNSFARITPTVQLSIGSGTYAERTMLGPAGNALDYNLYTNSTYSTIFGNGTSGTQEETGSSENLFFNSYTWDFPIYAQLPGGQNVVPGTYTSQSITVTVTY